MEKIYLDGSKLTHAYFEHGRFIDIGIILWRKYYQACKGKPNNFSKDRINIMFILVHSKLFTVK